MLELADERMIKRGFGCDDHGRHVIRIDQGIILDARKIRDLLPVEPFQPPLPNEFFVH